MADISKLNLDSTNPSSPVYNIKDELARFERISYAQWQQMTPEQQAAKPYYIYDYPSERIINAENVGYDNTESGMVANNVQSAVDELNGGLASVTEQANKTVYQNTDRLVCFSSAEGAIIIMCHNPTLGKSIGISIGLNGTIARYEEADV